jgi:hypothetical protein
VLGYNITFLLLFLAYPHVEVGQITSTVALRDVESHEKGTRLLGDTNTMVWSSSLGDGRKADDIVLCMNYCCEIQRNERRMLSGRIV